MCCFVCVSVFYFWVGGYVVFGCVCYFLGWGVLFCGVVLDWGGGLFLTS